MINRSEAVKLLYRYIHEDYLIQHAFAVESIMSSLAEFLEENKTLWGIVGLLHDLDIEYTKDHSEDHGLVSSRLLRDLLPQNAIHAISAHNYIHTGIIPTTLIDKALIASDSLSSLIIASVKSLSDKRIENLSFPYLNEKMLDNSFAGDCDRSKILLCEDFGMEIDKFLLLGLKSLKGIPDQIIL
jgi:predicted hydrolase (HD superfamily)